MATFQAGKNWKDVDQKFLETLKAYAEKFEANSGYDVSFYSGYRPGSGQSEHGHGEAVDIRLTDRNTGQALPNYQVHGNPEVTRAYQSFANGLKGYADQNAPEIGQNLRWGGYFSGVGNPSKYGAMDLMHFDLGGRRGMGMLGGDFQHGFTPAQARTYGIQPGGGMGDTASLMKQQGAQGSAQPVAGAQPIPKPPGTPTPPGNVPYTGAVGSWMGFAMRPVDQGGLGLNRAQAAGLVGNLQQESFSDLRLNATGDQGTAHGIAQWRGDRWAGLQQYAAANGMNPNSHEAQQGFMRQELMGGYKGAYAALQAARTPEEAANAFRSKYEISNSGAAARIANANKLFGQGDQATTDDISRQSATGAAPSTQAPAGPGAAIGSAMRGAGQPGAGPPGGGGGGLGSILGMFGGGQQYSTMQQAQNIIKSMEIGGGGNIDTQLRPVVRDGQVYVVGTQGQNNVNIHVGPAASGVAPPGDSAGGAAIPTPTARPDNANAMGGPIPSPAPRPEGAGWGAGAQPVQNWQAPAPFQGATGNLNNTPGDRTFESLYNQRTGGAVFPPGGDVMQQRGQLSGEGGGKAPMAGESFSGRWQDRVGTPMQPSAPSMGAKAPVPYLSQDQLKGIDPQGSQMAPDQTPISSEQLSQLQSQDLGSMFDLGGMQMGQLADMSNYSPDMMDFGGGFGFG